MTRLLTTAGVLRRAMRIVMTESRLEDARRQYPSVDVDSLAASDPSGNQKYLDWMARRVAARRTPADVKERLAGAGIVPYGDSADGERDIERW